MPQMHLHPKSISKVEGSSRQSHTGLKSCNSLDAVGLKYTLDKSARCLSVDKVSRSLRYEIHQLEVEKPGLSRTVCPPPKETPVGMARNSPRLWWRLFSVNRSMLAPRRSTSCINSAASPTITLHSGSSGWPTKTAIIRPSLSNTNRVLLQQAISEFYQSKANV